MVLVSSSTLKKVLSLSTLMCYFPHNFTQDGVVIIWVMIELLDQVVCRELSVCSSRWGEEYFSETYSSSSLYSACCWYLLCLSRVSDCGTGLAVKYADSRFVGSSLSFTMMYCGRSHRSWAQTYICLVSAFYALTGKVKWYKYHAINSTSFNVNKCLRYIIQKCIESRT